MIVSEFPYLCKLGYYHSLATPSRGISHTGIAWGKDNTGVPKTSMPDHQKKGKKFTDQFIKDQEVGRWWWSLRQGRKVSQIAKAESHWQTSEAKMNQQFWDGQTDFPTQKPKMETISIILPHRSAIGRVCEENMQKEVNMSSTVHCNALSVERKTHLWFDLDLGRPGPCTF